MQAIDRAGTYLIRCKANGKVYVGSSRVSVGARKARHFQLLRRGLHFARGLQQDFNTHGADQFEFEVVSLIDDGTNLTAERELIALHDATDPERGYNTIIVPIEGQGRPRIPEEEKRVVRSFSIYEHHDEKVNRIMAESGLSRSAVFQKIIDDGYSKLVTGGERTRPLEGGSVAD
jgi:group I intron endonuclease